MIYSDFGFLDLSLDTLRKAESNQLYEAYMSLSQSNSKNFLSYELMVPDRFMVGLPEGDELYIPGMKECIFTLKLEKKVS